MTGLLLSFSRWAYELQGVYFWYAGGVNFRHFRTPRLINFRRNSRLTRNYEDVGLHRMFEIVRNYMNGRFSVIPGKRYDRKFRLLLLYQTKPTSSKLLHTQTSIQRVSLPFVMVAYVIGQTIIFSSCFFLLLFFLA